MPSHSSRRTVRHQNRSVAARANSGRPAHGYRRRGDTSASGNQSFSPYEIWHEPTGRTGAPRYIVQPAGANVVHPVSVDEIKSRLADLPRQFTDRLEVVQLSTLTQARRCSPVYGMQWGVAVYLYPVEENLVEQYVRPPTPQQQIEARMFGGLWVPAEQGFELHWTEQAIKDFYLNNVLIHEVGHLVDDRNRNFRDRERFANWFAIEYGYRPSRR